MSTRTPLTSSRSLRGSVTPRPRCPFRPREYRLEGGEPLHNATRASSVPAASSRSVFADSDRKRSECEEYRFARRRIPVSPAHVTSVLRGCAFSTSESCCRTDDQRSGGLVASTPKTNELRHLSCLTEIGSRGAAWNARHPVTVETWVQIPSRTLVWRGT